MKTVFIFLITLSMCLPACSASINPVAYRQQQLQQYQQKRYNQQRTRKIPYWQAQSNYTTRNKVYNSYGNTNYSYSTSSQSRYGSQW